MAKQVKPTPATIKEIVKDKEKIIKSGKIVTK